MNDDFKMDMTPLNAEQMAVMKKLIEFGQTWADQVKTIMVHHGLWNKNFTVKTMVTPGFNVLCQTVEVSRKVEDGNAVYDEQICRYKSSENVQNAWDTLSYLTSREFIHLFDGEENGSGEKTVTPPEKPLPADGLWIGDPRNDNPVDGGQ